MNSGLFRAKPINNHKGIAEYQTKVVAVLLMEYNFKWKTGNEFEGVSYLKSTNSTSKIKLVFGGITPPAPREP